MFREIKQYVCCMNSFKNRSNINCVIENMFVEKLKIAVSSNPLDNINTVDLPKFYPSKIILEERSKSA